jgi:hypothetical protein
VVGGRDAQEQAAERLRDLLADERPDLRAVDGFRGITGMSPTVVVVLAALPMIPFAAFAVLSRSWILIVVGVVVMGLGMVGITRWVTSTRIVVDVGDEIVVLTRQGGVLVDIGRLSRRAVRELPYWERTWSKVQVGDELVWVSTSVFAAAVERLATPADGGR